jgi:NADH-quinone oxidoreductase subunit J
MPGLPIVFFILAAVAIATAIGMLISKNAIYSALFLVLNFATVAVLYMILGAPFLALSQITVYAGSIMVLFLFVIMLLGAEHLQRSENLRWQVYVTIPLAAVLAVVLMLNVFNLVGPLEVATLPDNFGAPSMIGETLYTQYILPFLITAVILLVATVGAIILAKPDQLSPGQAVRRRNITAGIPSGSVSAKSRETPAQVQEEAIKQELP